MAALPTAGAASEAPGFPSAGSTSSPPTEWVVTRPGATDSFLRSTIWPDLVSVWEEATHFVFHNDDNMVLMVVLLGIVALIGGTKDLWFPPIHRHTFAHFRCPKLRSCPCMAWCCSLCWCWCPPYHPPFRLRIVVHEAWNLKGSLCHIAASCGNNPAKTTSEQPVPTTSTHYPVVWNEPLELEISTADEHVLLVLCEGELARGTVTLAVADFFPRLEGSLDEVMYLPERTLVKTVLGERDQGTLVLSLYATRPGKPLPEVMTALR